MTNTPNMSPLRRAERRKTATILSLSPPSDARVRFADYLRWTLSVLGFKRTEIVRRDDDLSPLRETGWIIILFDGGTNLKEAMDIVLRQRTDRIIVVCSEQRSDEERSYVLKMMDPNKRRSRSDIEFIDLISCGNWDSAFYKIVSTVSRTFGEEAAKLHRRRTDAVRSKSSKVA